MKISLADGAGRHGVALHALQEIAVVEASSREILQEILKITRSMPLCVVTSPVISHGISAISSSL